jgi:hypothetical protein
MRRVLGILTVCVGLMWSNVVSAQGLPVSILAKTAAAADDTTTLSFPAGGGVNTAGDKAGAQGVIGIQYDKEDTEFLSILFNLGATQTIQGGPPDFAAALLSPSLQGQGVAAAYSRSWPAGKGLFSLIGVGLRGGASTTNWQTADVNTPIGGGLMYFAPSFQFGTKTMDIPAGDDNKWRVTIDAAWAFRVLTNAIAQDSNDAFRARPEVLGTSKTSFNGFELTFALNLNDVQPFVRFNSFRGAPDIDGFTGAQLSFGVNALAPIFKAQ